MVAVDLSLIGTTLDGFAVANGSSGSGFRQWLRKFCQWLLEKHIRSKWSGATVDAAASRSDRQCSKLGRRGVLPLARCCANLLLLLVRCLWKKKKRVRKKRRKRVNSDVWLVNFVFVTFFFEVELSFLLGTQRVSCELCCPFVSFFVSVTNSIEFSDRIRFNLIWSRSDRISYIPPGWVS